MKNQIALLVYPQFSYQEIGNTCALFRWYFDSPTVVFASSLSPVPSEEGLVVLPDKSLEAFQAQDYDCLVLPGCSDVRESLRNEKLISFLKGLKHHPDLVIGAICGGPMFLSLAGLLDDKKFTNQLYVEMNQRLPFIREENLVYAPLVEDGNIITATGDAYGAFAVALARKLGYECRDDAYGSMEWASRTEEDYKFHLDEQGIKEFEEAFADFL